MSKSKRAAQETGSPAPRQKKSLFIASGGGLRTGWLLAASLLACAAAALATRFGLVRAFGALFEAWGIDAGNAGRAPAWARALYVWHGSLGTLAYAAALLLVSRGLRRLWGVSIGKRSIEGGLLLRAALMGVAAALAVAALCLVPDSARLEWPLSAPRLSGALPALLGLSLLTALAEEAFTKGVLYDGLQKRWGGAWAALIACGAFFAMNGGWAAGIVGGLNVALLGLVGCLIYARRGMWASAGFRWGWSAVNALALGFGGGEYAVYRLYGVSEALLTGGDYGPVYGLWTTLALAGMIAWMLWKGKKQK